MDFTVENICLYLKKFPHRVLFINIIKHFFKDFNKKLSTKNDRNIYQFCYRLVRRFRQFIDISKNDGFLWLELLPAGFDLIVDNVKFKQSKSNIYSIPYRCSEYRRTGIINCLHHSTFNYNLNDESSLLFSSYLDDIHDKYILLLRERPISDPRHAIALKYSTRFNTNKTVLKNINNFEHIFNVAGQKYKKAVFLTLTTDPKLFPNIWEANRHFAIAINKFLSFLVRRLSKRPYYVATYEYTKRTGLIHAHIIFFGLRFLIPKYLITKEWLRCGQGKINYIYRLINENGRFVFPRERPKDVESNDAEYYLKKYLLKALSSKSNLFHYWIFNKRFFSCSRCLQNSIEPPGPRYILWRMIGIYRLYNIPDCFIYDIKKLEWLLKPG